MLTRLIVGLYAWIIEVSLWLVIVSSGIAGYYLTVPMLHAAGTVVDNEAAWQIYGAAIFVVVTFLASAVVVGPFLVLVDIWKAVKATDTKKSRSRSESDSGNRDESNSVGSSGTGGASSSTGSGRRSGSRKGRGMPEELKEPFL